MMNEKISNCAVDGNKHSFHLLETIGDIEIVAYVRVSTTGDYFPCPVFAQFNIKRALIHLMYYARSLCTTDVTTGISSVTLRCAPTAWHDNDLLQIQDVGLEVSTEGFYYKGYPKDHYNEVETHLIRFEEFEQIIMDAVEAGEIVVYFGDSIEDFVVECVENNSMG